jgi:DNA-binding beta-propeller fold protein YncE
MDDRRFDAALRALDSATSRRRGLAAALGVFLGAAGLDAAATGKPDATGGPGAEGPCGNGSERANRCNKNRECCTNYCNREIGSCRRAPAGTSCNRKTICRDGTTCYQGVCTKHRDLPGGRCKRCINGCCLGSRCADGTSPTACGSGGLACGVCSASDQPLCVAKNCDAGTWSPLSQTPAVTAPVGVAIAADQRTLYVTRDDPSASVGEIAIWTRSSVTAEWSAQPPLGTFGNGTGQLTSPRVVALAPDGLAIYVVDSGNGRIARWSRTSTTAQWTWLSPIGSQGTNQDQFQGPYGLALSADQRTLAVTDQLGNRVSIWFRSTTSEPFAWQTSFGTQGSGWGQFTYPTGIAFFTNQLLYVTDYNNNRVTIWQRSSATATDWNQFGSFGTSGSGVDEFSAPAPLVIAADGRTISVVDSGNNRISIWKRNGNDPFAWDPLDQVGSAGSAPNQFSTPAALAVAPDNVTMYVGDFLNNRISTWRQQA